MTYEEFVEKVLAEIDDCPKDWRKGQSVFNVVNQLYGVARYVQFNRGIDCFYRDDKIEEFLEACWDVLKADLGKPE